MNAVIGSGIFLLPGKAAGLLGPAAVVALLLAGGFSVLVALCFAEVAGRYEGTGAAYLYTTRAFGRDAGFFVGWISWVIRVISGAALANGVAEATAAVVPALRGDTAHAGIVVAVLCGLAVANVLGVRMGASVINGLTVVKLLPLAVFVGVGAWFVDPGQWVPFAPDGFGSLGEATLLVLWAYAGFENVAVVAGETREPQRHVPVALMTVMAVVMVLYVAVFLVAAGTHPAIAGAPAPVAGAASAFLGPVGGTLIGAGIAVSVFGTAAGSALIAPRFLYALAADGHLPATFSALHERYRTPVVSILTCTVLSLGLGLTGGFEQLAVISVVARFAQFVPTCLAVLVLRSRPGVPPTRFQVPGGPVVPVLALVLCVGLLAAAPPWRLLAGAAAITTGIPAYLLFRRR